MKKIRIIAALLALAFTFSVYGAVAEEATDNVIETTESTVEEVSVENDEPTEKYIEKMRISLDGTIYESRAYVDENGNAYLPYSVLKTLFGETAELPVPNEHLYSDAHAAAKAAGVASYDYDSALDSIYIWTTLPEFDVSNNDYGLGTPSDDVIIYSEFFDMLDIAVDKIDSTKKEAWSAMLPDARESENEMTRFEAMAAILYAAATIGGECSEFNCDWHFLHEEMKFSNWEEIALVKDRATDLIPECNPYTLGGFSDNSFMYDWGLYIMSSYYTIARLSPTENKMLLDYDNDSKSFHFDEYMTVSDAITTLTRFIDSAKSSDTTISLSDVAATNYNEAYITDEHLAIAEEMPAVNDDNLPQWHGAALSRELAFNASDIDMQNVELFMRKLSEYGFNCVRYMLNYETMFNRDASLARKEGLEKLDMVIAYAMKYRIHVNVMTITLPGRWAMIDENFVSTGDFDLFLNPIKQEQAKAVWRLIAKRYAKIPSSVLSFHPLWETANWNLSSGISCTPYTTEQIAPIYSDIVGVIREEDDDRFIIYEPTSENGYDKTVDAIEIIKPVIEKYDNIQLLSNFCSTPFVYAEMTATAGQNIDHNNHSMFKPSYPVTIYSIKNSFSSGAPLVFNGDLFAGTKINLYLQSSTAGKLSITADGIELHNEQLNAESYETGYLLSGFYPYATSDKYITVTLPENTETLTLSFTGDSVVWSGIDVVLPEEYAVERWWFKSYYDIYNAGGEGDVSPELKETSTIMLCPNGGTTGTVTINSDVTFTTSEIMAEANSETIDKWGEEVSKVAPNSLVRLERPAFNIGCEYLSALRYEDDFLSMCDKYGFGWISHDMTNPQVFYQTEHTNSMLAGAKQTKCSDGYVLKGMLDLFQAHMEKPIVLFSSYLDTTADDTKVSLSWESVTDATNYKIQRKTASDGWSTIAGTTADLCYDDVDIENGTRYSYRVLAYNESTYLNASNINTATAYNSAPVLTATAENDGVTLSWTQTDAATKYRVQRKEYGGSWQTLCDEATESFTDTTTITGVSYNYRVLAFNEALFICSSNAVKITFNTTDTTLSAMSENGTAELSWQAVTDAGVYRILRRAKTGSWETLDNVTSTNYTDSTATIGVEYQYLVFAFGGGKCISCYDEATVVII